MRAKVASYNNGHEHDKLVKKIQQLMAIDREAGLAAKVALLSGLRKEEMIYAFCEQVCDDPSCCGCKKLHVTNKRNGLTIIVINWLQNDVKRCYFTMMPGKLWEQFRSLPAFNESDIKAADKVVSKATGIKFSDIRSLFCQTMAGTMNSKQIEILTGVASPYAARNCLMLEVAEIMRSYVLAWEKVGVILPVI